MRTLQEMSIGDALLQSARFIDRVKRGFDSSGALMTLSTVFDQQYKPDRAKTCKAIRSLVSVFNAHVRPALGDRPIGSLTECDFQRLVDGLTASPNGKRAGMPLSERTRNRITANTKGLLTWLYEKKKTDHNLGAGLKLSIERQRRKRVLEPHEIEVFFSTLATFDQWFQKYVLLSLMTGMRQSEVLGSKFEWIDWSAQTITLPETKSGESRTVPLCDEALQVCRELLAVRQNEYLFPGKAGIGHRTRPSRQISKLFELSGIEGMTPHDWRRTFLTRAAQLAPLHEVSELAGHKVLETTRLYLVPRQDHLHAVVGTIGRDFGAMLSRQAAGEEVNTDDPQ